MKILIVSADNLYLTPYSFLYTDILDKNFIDYNVVFWDKNNNESIEDKRYIRCSYDKTSTIRTILGYVCFRNQILQILKNDSYDFIVCLHQITSLLLSYTLVNNYSKKYIYDIRDYSYEKYFIVRLIQQFLVNNSRINIISSEGFKNFLPKGDYEVAHNVPNLNCAAYKIEQGYTKEPIIISYIGLIRFMDQNKRIIDFFANDTRFQLEFIGTNAELLQQYCEEKGINNVSLLGTFNPSQTLSFYEKADLIMNLYGNHTPLLDYALSNKLYYAATVYKPILVCPQTYMEEISTRFCFGYVLRMSNDIERDDLYNYFVSLDRSKLKLNCDEFMKYVQVQNDNLTKKLEDIFFEK